MAKHSESIQGQEGDIDLSRAQASVQSGLTERVIPELDNPITEQVVRQAI